MGYRSNGGIVIFGPEPEMLANLTALRMTQTHPVPWNGELEGLRLYRDGTNLVWHLEYSDWKMYDAYPDVRELNRIFLESEHFPALSGYKWRFGEDDDDVEHEVFGDAADEDICIVDKDLYASFPGVPFEGAHPDAGEFYLIADCGYSNDFDFDFVISRAKEVLRAGLPANLHPHIYEQEDGLALAAHGLSREVVNMLLSFGEALLDNAHDEPDPEWGYAGRCSKDDEPKYRGRRYADFADISLCNTVTHLYQTAYHDLENYPDLNRHAEDQDQ